MKNSIKTVIEWESSYEAHDGWLGLEYYKPVVLICISCGLRCMKIKKLWLLLPITLLPQLTPINRETD
jgi:hypothetical protein